MRGRKGLASTHRRRYAEFRARVFADPDPPDPSLGGLENGCLVFVLPFPALPRKLDREPCKHVAFESNQPTKAVRRLAAALSACLHKCLKTQRTKRLRKAVYDDSLSKVRARLQIPKCRCRMVCTFNCPGQGAVRPSVAAALVLLVARLLAAPIECCSRNSPACTLPAKSGGCLVIQDRRQPM